MGEGNKKPENMGHVQQLELGSQIKTMCYISGKRHNPSAAQKLRR